ncbi:MAG: CHASE2 domain-containing protein [Sphingobium sp.]|nr:CHASE2 domain-containing protein [Sphingobium sp.]MBP8670564.1 CHASE2 domain-containing protein [Sphingobium sp.]MBP9157639.1 CHASE2 domain-containing protein [Sphingobium sp.]MCC6481237.1 CHASE2 domain-containing protein [Sphingomonadaceae bacterium]
MKFHRLWLEWAMIGIVASLMLFMGERAGLFERAARLLYDFAAPYHAAPASDALVILAIDNESLGQIGRWPWPRDVHARAIDRLKAAGARAILYDVLFLEPTPHDPALARAMAAPGAPVYLPILFDIPGNNGAPYTVLKPVGPLAGASAGRGIANLELDSDGRARRIALKAMDAGQWTPHLAERAYRALRGTPSPAYRRAPDERPVVDMAFNPAGSFRTVSFVHLWRGETPPALLNGKTVIVGATASGLGDLYPVPGSAELMAGAEIQANLLNSLLADRFITPMGREWVAAWSLIPLWLLMLAFWRLSPTQSLLLTLGVAGALLFGSVLALGLTGCWAPPFAALLGVVVVYPLWSWRRLCAVTQFLDTQIDALLAQSAMPAALLAGHDMPGEDRIGKGTERLHQIIALMQKSAVERQEMLQFLSHDMRGPQAAIIALLDNDASPKMPERERTVRARIRRYAETTLTLADNFVQLARLESQPAEQEPVDVTDAMAQAIDMAWPQAHAAGIVIERNTPHGEDLWVLGDAAALVRAFTNLLLNAVQASPPASIIRCEMKREGGFALASVCDEGPGLPPERKADPFARFGYTRTASGAHGSGLGLAFVAAVARQCGGEALYTETHSGGAHFTLRLPLWEEDEG